VPRAKSITNPHESARVEASTLPHGDVIIDLAGDQTGWPLRNAAGAGKPHFQDLPQLNELF
jgi:hypothetical protein